MDSSIASNLMYHLAGDEPGIEHAPKEIDAWLESLPLPMDLKRMLQWYWPKHGVQLGPIHFHSPMGIRHAPWTDAMLPHKLLALGDCPNGDAFVVDFSSDACNVGFVTREEYDGESDPRPYYQPTFRCLETYLYRVAEERYLPADYYDARSLIDFLQAERDHDSVPPFRKRT